MTLRLRLVLALFALMLAGLTLFGVTSYSLYARSQYDRLDGQIRSSAGFVSRQFSDRGHPGDGTGGHEDDRGGPGSQVPLSTYAELRDRSGAVVASSQVSGSTRPKLPGDLSSHGNDRFFTTGSDTGSERWRVYVTGAPGPEGEKVVVAVPLTDVTTALRRLTLIETGGGIVLLAALCGGAWIILRRGLRPLEEMATTAGHIATGDLSQRVEHTDVHNEVGQLGSALNTMLEEIERTIAERDATEQRLRQFLSDASHELRTPLTSIQGFAELFRISDRDDVDLPTILRRIEDESARMKVLVEDLLLLARLDETRPHAHQPVDLAVLAADACSDAVAADSDRPVTLDAPEPVVVAGDEALLRQAVGNLVANAGRHTPAGSPIEVGAHVVDGTAVVTVRDHGEGLDPDALAHVFDGFWQADRARAGTGTGLGLSIVAGVASDHGGRAHVVNAEDGGAIFELRLPLGEIRSAR